MKSSASAKLAAVALGLAVIAAALLVWLARDRPWMRSAELPGIALAAAGPFLVVALLAGTLAAWERGHAGATGRLRGVLIGMLIGCGCWLLWVFLVTTAETWL